jgi:predicted secreted protein
MANEVQSKELLFKYGGLIIAKTNSFSLEVNKETIDVTTLDDSEWQRIIAGQKSWSASVDGIVTRGAAEAGKTNYDTLMQELINNDAPVEIIITSDIADDKFLRGNALLTGLSISGSTNEVVTWSGSLAGDGALVQDTVPTPI